jgi:hypothetical protein
VGVDGGGGVGGLGGGGVRRREADGGAVVAAAAGGGALRAAGDQGPPLPLLRGLRPRDGGAHGGRHRQANAAPVPLAQRAPARPRVLPPLEGNLRYVSLSTYAVAFTMGCPPPPSLLGLCFSSFNYCPALSAHLRRFSFTTVCY